MQTVSQERETKCPIMSTGQETFQSCIAHRCQFWVMQQGPTVELEPPGGGQNVFIEKITLEAPQNKGRFKDYTYLGTHLGLGYYAHVAQALAMNGIWTDLQSLITMLSNR